MSDELLKPLIKSIIQQVVAELGQTSAPQLYDVGQAAARLRVPKRWLYEHAASGAIPSRKVGKYLRFSDADLAQISRSSGSEPDAHANGRL